MREIIKDKDTKTDIFIESQTIKYAINPSQFKEDLQKAKNEVEDLENAVKNTSKPLGKDKRNIFSNLRAQRWSTSFYNVIGSRVEELGRQFKAREINEEDVKEALRDIVKGYGKDAFFRKKTRFSKQWKTNKKKDRQNNKIKKKIGE